MKQNRTRLSILLSIPILFSLSCSLLSPPGDMQGLQRSVVGRQPPDLPIPPAVLEAPQGETSTQASFFASQLASKNPNARLAAWLGIYQALGVPVIGQDGKPLFKKTGDDPIGPRFWQVWYASGLDLPGRGITFKEVGQIFAAALPGSEGASFGQLLLDDLRQAAKSKKPAVQLLGLFVRERVLRGPSHADILDLTITVNQAVLDMPTVELLSWLILRAGLFNATSRVSLPESGITLAGYRPMAPAQAGKQAACSDIPGSGTDVAYWTQWLTNKLGGGFILPSMKESFPSVVERILSKSFPSNQANLAAQAKELGGKVLGYSNVVASAVSLLLQLGAMTINPSIDPDPLERTTSSRNPGKDGTIHLQVYSDPQSIPDGNKLETCLGSFFATTMGVSFSLPSPGPIKGAEVRVEGGQGFPDLVMFNINGQSGKGETLRADANDQDVADFKVFGAPQKRDIPQSAQKVKKEFSVLVTAQPEEGGLNTLINLFFGGLTFGSGAGAASGLGSVVDMLKTFRYDMGEYVFDLTDWSTGYKVDVDFADGSTHYIVTGSICNGLDQPFTLKHEITTSNGLNMTGTLKFIPADASSGSIEEELGQTYKGKVLVGIKAAGQYTVNMKGDSPSILIQNMNNTANVKAPGASTSNSFGTYAWPPIELQPGGECPQ